MADSMAYRIFTLIGNVGLLAALIFGTAGVNAATVRIDDSGTVVGQTAVPMQWTRPVARSGANHSIEGSVRVALRLNLTSWVNQPVRLYMALAPVVGQPIFISWRTQGNLLPGNLRSGERALIFNGVASAAFLVETIELAIKTDGRGLLASQGLQFYFEIDTP